MKNALLTISLFFAMSLFQSVWAQKAYDTITYKATINGNTAALTLADGYLLASKVIIHSNHGYQVFAPNANEADEKGNLQFKAVKGFGKYKNNKTSWFIISGLNQPDLPSLIKAVYCDGKMRKYVVFE